MYLISDLWNALITSPWLFVQDAIEICVFYCAIFSIASWLQRAHNRFLLYFFAYLAAFIITSLLSLTNLYTLILYSAPFCGIFFIVFHQERLQKNFVALNKITVDKSKHEVSDKQWPELLMRGLLYAMNKEKSMICALEFSDCLPLESKELLNAPLSMPLLTMLVDSALFNQSMMVWLRKNNLIGFNSTLTWDKANSIMDTRVQEIDIWIQDALIITQKTDAFIIRVDARKRLFDVVCQGKIVENISSQKALEIIKKYTTMQPTQKEIFSPSMRHDDVFKHLQS